MGPRRDRGAALVEMALVLPLLIVLLFGIVETGWIFAQLTETRNAAREGARLAVVDFGTPSEIAAETCARADLSTSGATVFVSTSGDVTAPIDDPSASVTITIVKGYQSLTKLLDPLFGSVKLDSTVTMRVERPLTNLTSDMSPIGTSCP